jgi:hypothetical protein
MRWCWARAGTPRLHGSLASSLAWRLQFPDNPGGETIAYKFERLDFKATERKLDAFYAEFEPIADRRSRSIRDPSEPGSHRERPTLGKAAKGGLHPRHKSRV